MSLSLVQQVTLGDVDPEVVELADQVLDPVHHGVRSAHLVQGVGNLLESTSDAVKEDDGIVAVHCSISF